MRSTRKKIYSKNKRKTINRIIVGATVTLSLIVLSQVTEKTFAFFTDSQTINASFKTAFVFPSSLQQIIGSLPKIECEACDEKQLKAYEELANKLDQEITFYYIRASRESDSNNTVNSKIVYNYVSDAYHEFEMKKQILLDQITSIRDELARKESEEKEKKEKEKKEKEKNEAEAKEKKEQETQLNEEIENQTSDHNNDMFQPEEQTETLSESNNENNEQKENQVDEMDKQNTMTQNNQLYGVEDNNNESITNNDDNQ
ncbi:flagellar biosynthesis GTPase FlhF [Paenibacillus castaneae]|uniref:hypothetical protein n=1 Tax=Paenibacillus castaneae TaxID=474957 RepID=UPI00141ADCEC|nr:hypothetical protein [Paenibacillus castaneae]NIK75256.1 flagellar biosynthesis GTPase FlhF [Paenibacillus castaneae]